MKPLLAGIAAFLATAAGLAIAQEPPGGGMAAGARAMMRADANGDGVITREEYLAQAGQRFDRMDLNHDGKIDQTEMQQVGERMRGRGGMRGGGDMPPPPPPPGGATPPQR